MRAMTKPKPPRAKLDFMGDGVWVTIAEAARRKGVTPRTIRNAIDDKRLLNRQHVKLDGSERMVLMVLTGELDGVRFRPCKPRRGKR